MSVTSFDEILKGAHEPVRDQGSAVQTDPNPAPTNEAPTGETTSTAAAPGAAQPAKPNDDDEGETPAPDVYGKVPLKALESERAKRQDWKTKAIQAEERQRAAEEKLAAMEKARTEAPQAPAQANQQHQQQAKAPPAPPNPVEDPEGFQRYMAHERQQQKLHASEIALRQQKPDVDEKLAVFMAAAKENPSLLAKANDQPHPWGWMYEEAQRIAARNEIGDDPTAYRSKIEAEIRAKIEAERRDGAPTIEHQPHKPPPSLAGARSSAPSKGAPAWTGPAPLSSLVGGNAASVRR